MVKETALYDLLEIDPSATEAEIRKAYLKMAKKLHPDRNRDDPNAEQKFNTMKEAYEILSDPVKRETYDQNGYEYLKLMEDPLSALNSPTAISKLLSSVSPFKRNALILLLTVGYVSIIYFFVTLGLRIDSTITWNWSTIFIPFYIVEAIVAIYVIIDTWTALRRCFRKKAKRSDIEQELNYYDEDSSKDRYLNELEMDPPLVDLLSSVGSILIMVGSITVVYSLDTKQIYLTSSLIPYFISSLLDVLLSFIKICYHLVTILQAVFSIVSLITPLTILFCAMVYDGIVDWSYTQAFIPLWIYFICIAIRDFSRLLICKGSIKHNMSDLEFSEYKRDTCSSIFIDLVFFVVILFVFLKVIGKSISIFWVFFPILLIFICFGFCFVCSIVFVLRNPHILEQAENTAAPAAAAETSTPQEETTMYNSPQPVETYEYVAAKDAKPTNMDDVE